MLWSRYLDGVVNCIERCATCPRWLRFRSSRKASLSVDLQSAADRIEIALYCRSWGVPDGVNANATQGIIAIATLDSRIAWTKQQNTPGKSDYVSASNRRKGDRCQQHCRDCYSSLAPRLLAPFAWSKLRYRPEFVQQMADAEHGVTKQHSRSGITHYRFDALALRFAVAVDLASIAGRFLLVEWTDLKALQGVREQSFAVTAKRALPGMMIATEDPHHRFDRLLFARDMRARQIRARRRCFDCSWHIVQGALSTELAGQEFSAYINTILYPDAANVSRHHCPLSRARPVSRSTLADSRQPRRLSKDEYRTDQHDHSCRCGDTAADVRDADHIGQAHRHGQDCDELRLERDDAVLTPLLQRLPEHTMGIQPIVKALRALGEQPKSDQHEGDRRQSRNHDTDSTKPKEKPAEQKVRRSHHRPAVAQRRCIKSRIFSYSSNQGYPVGFSAAKAERPFLQLNRPIAATASCARSSR